MSDTESKLVAHTKSKLFRIQWGLFVVALMFTVCGACYVVYLEHDRLTKFEQQRLLAASRVIKENLQQNLESIKLVLTSLRKSLANESVNQKFNERLASLADAMPGVRTLIVVDGQGRLQASSRPELLTQHLELKQRDYFRQVQQDPDAEKLFISAPFVTSLDIFSLSLAQMIPGPQGEFAGVVVATLDPGYFAPFLESVRYAPDMVVAMFHGDGAIFLVKPPDQYDFAGKNAGHPGSIFSQHIQSGLSVNIFNDTGLATGEQHMTALQTVQPVALKMDKPMGVAVSRLQSEIYASWKNDVLVSTILITLVAIAFASGLYAYQRRSLDFLLQEAEIARRVAQSEARLVRAELGSKSGNWEFHIKSGKLVASIGAARVYGVDPEKFGLKLVQKLVLTEDRPVFDAAMDKLYKSGEAYDIEFRIRAADTGEIRDIHAVTRLDLEVGIVFGLNQDITQRKASERALKESEARFRMLGENSHDVIWTLDLGSQRLGYVSPSVERLTGYTAQEVIGQALDFVITKPSLALVQRNAREMLEQIENGRRDKLTQVMEVGQRHRDGHIVQTEVVTTYLLDNDGKPQTVLGITRDITERKKIEAELARMAQLDSLSGLNNRRHFMNLAQQELTRCARYGGPLSILMLDIDNFKQINDRLGHQTGDLVIRTMGRLCLETLRDIDVIGRLGGEEFAVVLPQTDGARALDAAERLRKKVATTELALEQGLPLRFTISIGVATLTDTNNNLDMLLGEADKAMYQAKRSGRNRVCAQTAV
jgi:diguanylate cyclase (GGDEF)-like protein/PAS domain S-box-containing protein